MNTYRSKFYKWFTSGLYQPVCILTILSLLNGCVPDSATEDIGPAPTGEFTVTPIAGKTNTFLLTSTSDNTFYYKWDKGDGDFVEGNKVDTAYFADMGDYTIKLMVLGKGGHGQTEQVVKVTQDDPDGCAGKKALLTGCANKTWILEPAAGSLWVGELSGNQWWANGANEVTGSRACVFDDTYTFSKDGSFVFANQNTFGVDEESGKVWPNDMGLPVGCHAMSEIPSKYSAWGSGNHTFKIVGGNKLQVNGKGAFMALYKVGETEITAVPNDVVTYDILEMTETKMVLRKAYSWGQWKFTFKAK
ncbi:PKD domain-containing protein [Xanthocytophaga agilis]|uniref:PKD domain-containing protein n=1 Tax=Xanthocytophaga agilis TaxID=3048010 RepID=A0AAE3RA84_9BACT|nr:PKD domain-containing protein [Xanthocytophaga agilis]MDJ1504244.1 PKD domain-containing protein [Xanthocytophaga agilis]